jgi:predicted AlkP superfamily phosphohydrolase/phosphomutase
VTKTRVAVIGLDSASPDLLFGDLRSRMPNLSRLIDGGYRARLRSCYPPITIPAWMVMMTGKGPGTLGITGFRHRKGYSYTDAWIADSRHFDADRVWDVLGRASLKSCVVSVPPSYPPRPLEGWSVGCFLTPDTDADYTYPSELKDEIQGEVGEYLIDVDFRTEAKERLLDDLYLTTESHFETAKHLAATKPWDFFMSVEIGTDRVQHAFWKYYDKEHHLHEPGNRFESAIPDYYAFVDEKLGELVETLGDAVVVVVSDHGVKRMKGAFCINEFLHDEGWLAYEGSADADAEGVELGRAGVDWSRTRAWAWGGYYARVFMNVEGREETGTIPVREYEASRARLAELLRGVPGPGGEKLDNLVFTPEEIYGRSGEGYPDLMVFFDDLYWRAAGTVGHGTTYLLENDKGPDDAVHDWDGIFVLYDPERATGVPAGGVDLGQLAITSVAPTVLRLFGVDVPQDMEGRPIEGVI